VRFAILRVAISVFRGLIISLAVTIECTAYISSLLYHFGEKSTVILKTSRRFDTVMNWTDRWI